MKIKEFTYFYPEAPKLLHIESDLLKRLSDDPLWVAEKKYNENRLMLHAWGGCKAAFSFWNRHEKRFDYVPSADLLEALEGLNLKGYCLFDGGLRHNKVIGVKHRIVIYDIYVWDNTMLLTMPFFDRRTMLTGLFPCNESIIRVPKQYPTDFVSLFHRVIKHPEIEGLVLKKLTGKIAPGRKAPVNSSWMFKVREPSGRYKF